MVEIERLNIMLIARDISNNLSVRIRLTKYDPECNNKIWNDETLMMGGNFIAVLSLSLPGFIHVLDDYNLGYWKSRPRLMNKRL